MRVTVNDSLGRLGGDGTRPAGRKSEAGRISALWLTILWELLAIGLVGLATYLVVSLVVWLSSIAY